MLLSQVSSRENKDLKYTNNYIFCNSPIIRMFLVNYNLKHAFLHVSCVSFKRHLLIASETYFNYDKLRLFFLRFLLKYIISIIVGNSFAPSLSDNLIMLIINNIFCQAIEMVSGFYSLTIR